MAGSDFRARNCSVPKSVSFEMFSSDEIRKMGVVQVVTPLVLSATGQGLPGGLYDPAMGCHNRSEICKTCQKNLMACSGHFGYIELPLPVINPIFSKTVLQIFRLTCITCSSVIIPVAQKHLAITQLKLLDYGLLEDALEAEQILAALIDQETALEEDAKKTSRVNLDARVVMERFSAFLDERLAGHTEIFDENCRGVEALRNSVIKRVLRFAQINYKCPHCSTVCKRIVQDQSRILYSVCRVDESPEEGASPGETKMSQKYLTPSEAKIHMQVLWSKERDFMQHVFPVIRAAKTKFPTDVFFIETLAVPPPKNRPSQTANNITVEHPLNVALRYVVSSCSIMQYLVRAMKEGVESLPPEMKRAVESVTGESFEEKLGKTWNELQTNVDHVMDKDKPQTSVSSQIIGLKQVIEKKEGLFRMNMMGKRVDYAARTVITPDPNINIDEIGIPDAFARTLTFPCTVSPANVYHLRQLILNGPLQHPGATSVMNENGTLVKLHETDRSDRERVANRLLVADKLLTQSKFGGVKTVYRHLQNGDLLLLNRQPSLHRPSIMAHRARVLKGEKVFRLHYANCKHYNADFDGDEMNAHFPQDEESRAEASTLVSVCNHFLVPKDGTPLAGLIQDHIVGAVKLTVRGRFFEEQEYQELVFFALGNRHFTIRTEPPAIILPVPLWSGKQVVSTIVKNLTPANKPFLTFTSNTKIKAKDWQNQLNRVPYHKFKRMDPNEMTEAEVVFQEGELLCGVLDKVHLGATPNGLCHAFYELYGSQAVGLLLSAFSRLLTSFLQKEGFTLGIKDVMVAEVADEGREETVVDGRELGLQAAASAFGLSRHTDSVRIEARLKQAHRSGDPKARAGVDAAYKKLMDKVTNAVTSECIPYGLVTIFPHNNLQLMVLSGAKGSAVNALQMSCLLGQIELEGKRPPLTLAGKSLPSFRPYDPSPRAGGYIFGRFLTGIRPQEFFFHCMAGREGLIDTAVKTSRSGYLQRCLVKLLEGVVTQYDMTVRDSDGCVVQFLYGEDGLDVCKAQYLKTKQMKFLEQNASCFSMYNQASAPDQIKNAEVIDFMKQDIDRWKKNKGTRSSNGFLYFSKKRAKNFRHLTNFNTSTGRSFKTEALETVWRNLSDEEQAFYDRKGGKVPEPVLGTYLPSSFGVISEELQGIIDNYSGDPMFRTMLYSKAVESLSNPGDAVGVLAAQSVGEPSTQMTLNTFHFAGRGEMNVTLGIPRLREILMIASENIRTPCMDIPFKDHVTYPEAQKLRMKLTRVTMAQVLEEVEVTETLSVSGDRSYALKFNFLPYEEYRDVFCVNPQSILTYVERTFIAKRLIPAIQKALSLGKSFKIHMGKEHPNQKSSGRSSAGEDDGDDVDSPTSFNTTDAHDKKSQGEEHESSDEEEMAEDADATESRRAGKQHETGYEEPEPEDLDEDDDDSSEYGSYQAMRSDLEEPDSEDETIMRRVMPSFAVGDAAYRARVEMVGHGGGSVSSYSFDKQKQQWCTVVVSPPSGAPKLNVTYVLKELADKCVIHQVSKISRAFLEVTPKKQLRLKTEGINILAMAEYQEILDLNRLHCNNIHTMARHYGVEAALKVLIKELTDVFKAYGIVIDPRHLSLIADFMMTSGTYRPFNRLGIASSTSPLHQMSFETVVNFLRDAALGGKRDDLQNPSACLIAGKLVKVGTELFDCFASPPLPNSRKGSSSKSGSVYDRIHTTGVKKIYQPFTNGNVNGYDPYSYLSTTKNVVKIETSTY